MNNCVGLFFTQLACGVLLVIVGHVGLQCVGIRDEAGLESCLRDSMGVDVNVLP